MLENFVKEHKSFICINKKKENKNSNNHGLPIIEKNMIYQFIYMMKSILDKI